MRSFLIADRDTARRQGVLAGLRLQQVVGRRLFDFLEDGWRHQAIGDLAQGQHGRLAREKDLKTLLRAFIRLRSKNKHLKLLIVAEGLPWLKKMLESQEGVISVSYTHLTLPTTP